MSRFCDAKNWYFIDESALISQLCVLHISHVDPLLV
jgi:hypothetical protein